MLANGGIEVGESPHGVNCIRPQDDYSNSDDSFHGLRLNHCRNRRKPIAQRDVDVIIEVGRCAQRTLAFSGREQVDNVQQYGSKDTKREFR